MKPGCSPPAPPPSHQLLSPQTRMIPVPAPMISAYSHRNSTWKESPKSGIFVSLFGWGGTLNYHHLEKAASTTTRWACPSPICWCLR
eukprot:scaffold5523_cov127-Chaetoceros_neogracile.AAC.1